MRTALAGGKPDRVPIAITADHDFFCKAAGRPMWEFEYGDNPTRAAIQRDAYLRFPDNDYILCWGGRRPEALGSQRIVTEEGRPYLESIESGERSPIRLRKTAAEWTDGLGEEEYGTTSQSGYERPVESEADIEALLGPVSTVDALLEKGQCEPMAELRRDLGERAYLAVSTGANFYEAMQMMGGFEPAMVALLDNPGLFRCAMEHLARRDLPWLAAAARAGVDGVFLQAFPEGADMISPSSWREVALPVHRMLIDAAHEHGMQVLFWFLGDCIPLLRDLADLGIDGLVLEQSRRAYSSDPARVRQEVGTAFCVYGWPWEMDLIRDNREGITREVETQIRAAGTDGGFIMGTPYMTSEVQLEAVDHLCREVLRVSREVGY